MPSILNGSSLREDLVSWAPVASVTPPSTCCCYFGISVYDFMFELIDSYSEGVNACAEDLLGSSVISGIAENGV